MKVPLTVSDFLRRGALVYPDRPALIDEPGTAGSLGTITYRSLERRGRGPAVPPDEMGGGLGGRGAGLHPQAARVWTFLFPGNAACPDPVAGDRPPYTRP